MLLSIFAILLAYTYWRLTRASWHGHYVIEKR